MPRVCDRTLAWMVAIAVAAPACTFGSPNARPDGAPGDAMDAMDAMIDAPDAAPGVWWNRDWTRRRRIAIKHGELTGPVAGFPLLVRLPAEALSGSPTGDDLRFLLDHATELPYQIDTMGLAGALVWVRIPMLTRTGPAPELWVYYGNAAAPPRSNGSTVFGNQYVSVHHLDNNLGDSTGRNHTATATPGQTPSNTPGQIGGARDFDGQNDSLLLAGNEADFDFTTQLSVSAWIRRQALDTTYQAIVAKGDKSWRLHRENQTPFIGFGTTVGNVNQNQFGDVNIDNNNWHHVAIVLGSSTKRIYVDGQLDDTVTVGPTIDTNDFGVMFGRNEEAMVVPDRFWNGDLDEVRISGTARDEHWMFAEHHTVTDADFVQIGGEETVPP